MSQVNADKIAPSTGTTLTLGDVGDTITTAATPAGTLSNTPAFSVCTNAVTAITAATAEKIVLDREIFDSASAFASNRFTVPAGEGGKYFISAGINFLMASSSTTSNIQTMIYLNGSEHGTSDSVITNQSNITNLTVEGTWILNLAAADYIELWGYVSGSSTQYNGNATLQKTHMSGFKLLGV
jgi:hypothetical protein